jgi:hypothetical protein
MGTILLGALPEGANAQTAEEQPLGLESTQFGSNPASASNGYSLAQMPHENRDLTFE